jgi:hypothetical protein
VKDWGMSPEPTTAAASLIASAGEEMTKSAAGLLTRILGPAADAVGEYLRDRVKGYLDRNRTSVVNRAAEMVDEAKLPPHEVPLRTLLPIMEGAAFEEDTELRERWAALLANAATADDPDAVQPVFAAILRILTPGTARCLEALSDTHPLIGEQSYGGHTLTEIGSMTPESLRRRLEGHGPTNEELVERGMRRLRAMLDILAREGLVTVTPRLRAVNLPVQGSPATYAPVHGFIARDYSTPVAQDGLEIRISELGRDFLAACRPPGSDRIAPEKEESGPFASHFAWRGRLR